MDDIEDSVGESGVLHQFGEPVGDGWIPLGRLQNEGVAAGDRHSEHPHRDHCGEVERGDARTNAQGLAHRIDIDPGSGADGIFAFQCLRDAARIFNHFQTALNIAPRIRDHFAVFRAQQVRELIHVLFNKIPELEHDACPALRVGLSPFRLRGLGRINRLLQIGGRPEADMGLDLALVGVEHLADARLGALAAGKGGTADEMVNAAKHDTRPVVWAVCDRRPLDPASCKCQFAATMSGRVSMRKLIAVSCLLLTAAASPPAPQAKLRAIIAPVSQQQLRRTIATLVSFGTRHTLSSQTDPRRGIGAALEWTRGEFQRDSEACGNCLTIVDPSEVVTGERIPKPTRVRDMVAIQRGTERPNDVVIIQGHIDSRVSDIMNSTSDAPGANDDGSGTAAVLEAARLLSKRRFPGTIVYAALSGEEQGLYGGKTLADYARAQGWNVVAVLNNDIIGNICSSDGVCDAAHARVLSEGPRSQGQEQLSAATHALGGENDAPSRNISRFLASLAGYLDIQLEVRQIWRTDRFGRGGDHIPFLEMGYPAARISVAVENYNWQHQDVRTENGVRYGDTIDHVDFPYLAKMTKLNVAALAAIASAPPPPEPKVEGAVSTDTTVTWKPVIGAARYEVRWRRTDANNWEVSRAAPSADCGPVAEPSPSSSIVRGSRASGMCKLVLRHVRIDDWVFGVSSVSADGFESPVASAVPGGPFRPYIAPPKT